LPAAPAARKRRRKRKRILRRYTGIKIYRLIVMPQSEIKRSRERLNAF
jgi:hypothetical protein